MFNPASSDQAVRVRERQFNTAGPSVAGKHYMLDPLVRIHYQDVEELIEAERYFILHAPRQTGKTTALLALMHSLNASGRYVVAYANIEGAQTARNDVGHGMAAVTEATARQIALYTGDDRLESWVQANRQRDPHDRLTAMLEAWARMQDKPTVLLLDEVDALVGDTLVSLLRQLRAGYNQRPGAFPQSVILCGVRDVKDYRIQTTREGVITGGSAFNIKSESLRLGNLEAPECRDLWLQHTDDTGQQFEAEIFPELWEDTRGQPWLVNALAHELTWRNRALRDRSIVITLEHYHAAREVLIQSRATHLDQLVDKLREPRVHHLIAPLLRSEGADLMDVSPDDQQYVEDLGLIRTRPMIHIANRIYAEVIPRELTWIPQTRITREQPAFLTPDRRIDMPKLLAAFQQFFRENSEIWLERFDYKEAGPQLLLQAFLQRIINGGGRINREYGLGFRRTDLSIEWAVDEAQGYLGPVQRIVLELKLQKTTVAAVLAEGLPQVVDYARRCGADEAHLLVFNRKPKVSWSKKIWHKTETHEGVVVQVWGA